jgi:hypothetical protein
VVQTAGSSRTLVEVSQRAVYADEFGVCLADSTGQQSVQLATYLRKDSPS